MLPPFYIEPQFRLIEGDGTTDIALREVQPIQWDPAKVRDLKREAKRRGNRPTTLCLGRLEADAFAEYLKTIPGVEDIIEIDSLIYEGLEVRVLTEIESVLRVVEVIEAKAPLTPFPPRGPETPVAA